MGPSGRALLEGGFVHVARCAYGALTPSAGRQIVSDQKAWSSRGDLTMSEIDPQSPRRGSLRFFFFGTRGSPRERYLISGAKYLFVAEYLIPYSQYLINATTPVSIY